VVFYGFGAYSGTSILSGETPGSALLRRALPLPHRGPEKRNRLAAERGTVVGIAAGDEWAFDDHLAIDPLRAGVLEVGFQRRLGSNRPAAHGIGFDQRPRAVADRGDRLACADNGADKAGTNAAIILFGILELLSSEGGNPC
jgi:hypothetical protein